MFILVKSKANDIFQFRQCTVCKHTRDKFLLNTSYKVAGIYRYSSVVVVKRYIFKGSDPDEFRIQLGRWIWN